MTTMEMNLYPQYGLWKNEGTGREKSVAFDFYQLSVFYKS